MTAINYVSQNLINGYSTGTSYSTPQGYAANAGSLSPAEMELQSQQNHVNKEMQTFHEAVEVLDKQLRVFAKDGMFETLYKSSSNTDTFKRLALNSTRGLVKAYNNINTFIKSSDYLTGEGKKLLDGVKDLLQGKKAKDFEKMGITMNKKTDVIKFDEEKFSTYLGDEVVKVKGLLMDKKNLLPNLQELVSNIANKLDDYYFCKPFSVYA